MLLLSQLSSARLTAQSCIKVATNNEWESCKETVSEIHLLLEQIVAKIKELKWNRWKAAYYIFFLFLFQFKFNRVYIKSLNRKKDFSYSRLQLIKFFFSAPLSSSIMNFIGNSSQSSDFIPLIRRSRTMTRISITQRIKMMVLRRKGEESEFMEIKEKQALGIPRVRLNFGLYKYFSENRGKSRL